MFLRNFNKFSKKILKNSRNFRKLKIPANPSTKAEKRDVMEAVNINFERTNI